MALSTQALWSIIMAYSYVAFWIVTSAGVILYNKWILTVWGFNYPITLTMWHMSFCSVIAFALVRGGVVPSANMTRPMYTNSVVPIGALFSGTLWFGNAAYTYLSVSFIQMLKALMPAAVYSCGLAWGIEKKDPTIIGIMSVVTMGVMIASYGELLFVMTGVLFQLASICTESNRIVLVQILLQSKGVKLNPITTMYYISPCCLMFLFFPWVIIEAPLLFGANADQRNWLDNDGVFYFVTNAIVAFALNCAVFLLIGKTSALTMNIAGVVKDWILIYLSFVLFHGPISALNLIGYSIAFSAVCYYNYVKYQAMRDDETKKEGPKPIDGPTKVAVDNEEEMKEISTDK